MDDDLTKQEGPRERKKRETHDRIAQTGMRLFIANGYEATTLDAIAAAAGISRRTFFYYFKSKEDILLAWQRGFGEMLRAALNERPGSEAPLEAVRQTLLNISAQFGSDDMIRIDRLTRSSETLRARKQASYLQQEQALFEALCERWPQPEQRSILQKTAMAGIGVMRLAIEAWSLDGCTSPVAGYLEQGFAELQTAIADERRSRAARRS